MNAVICVPYRDDGAFRKRNWEAVQNWWLSLGYPVVVSGGPKAEAFDITKARNQVVAGVPVNFPDWDVALMTDADVVLSAPSQVNAALALARRTGQYVVAHDRLLYLSPKGSSSVALGRPAGMGELEMEVRETWETCFAFSRELWETIGGFDPRFRGFGHQVEAFFYASETLFGVDRVAGPCYHLWHPYSADALNLDLPANRELVERYWSASGKPDAMHELLGEHRGAA